ncbi:multiple ankyrin repeats single kh domain protein [Rutstroemia sp. NJR-2017a WRK4]|nr:multiple ankyrin repeats single kh domain protein [Rutstroemia sp. NJR-2017a WRK4]
MSDVSLRVMIPSLYSKSLILPSDDFSKVMERTFYRLRDVLPQQHDEDFKHEEYITSILRNLVSDNLHGNTLAFLNLAVFLLSNNLLEDRVADRIYDELFGWLKQDENHPFLRFILLNKMPTIDAFIEGIFCSAIHAGNLGLVRIMLQGRINPDMLIRIKAHQFGQIGHYTPLQVAALRRDYQLAELLLNSGADIYALKDVEQLYYTSDQLSNPGSSWYESYDFDQTPLQLAARSGSTEIAKLLISKGAAVNLPHSCGASALQNSIMARDLEITNLLLENGADIDACFGKSTCPLTCAISTGQMDLFEDLLNRGAQVNLTNRYGDTNFTEKTPLQCAVMMEEYEAVTQLLQRGANYAAEKGNLKLCKLLLHAHANPNSSPALGHTRNFRPLTALSAAVSSGNLEVVKLLLASGAKILYNRYGERTALEMAASLNNIEMIRFLLAHNPAASRDRSIFIAARLKNLEMIKLLCDSGADINKMGYGGKNVLSIALLLDSGANYNCPWGEYEMASMDGRGRMSMLFPLVAAAQKGDVEIVHLLLKAGADVNPPISDPTVLEAAVRSGNICLVQLLISLGAKVNHVLPPERKGNFTALEWAVHEEKVILVKLLLREGANAGDLSLRLAATTGNEEIVRILIDEGAAVNIPQTGCSTALQAAAEGGNFEIVKILLEKGADVHAPAVTDYGVTALQGAVLSRSLRMARLLIKKGADVAAPGSEMGSALEIAAQLGHLDMLKLLLLQSPKITATWRAQYENSIKKATSHGHNAAAKFLKYHQVF